MEEDETQKLVKIVKESLIVDPKTIRLVMKRIHEFPVEVIDAAKDYKVERLAIEQNQLSTIPVEIRNFTHLRYLNISQNAFKIFPEELCSVPNLEILDVSKNKIRKLPKDFGNLMSLKILQLSKNQIKKLPTYIGDMRYLQYLKLDSNPIQSPPKSVHCLPKGDEKEVMTTWLENLKTYLKQQAAGKESIEEVEESDKSSGEEGREKEHSPGVKPLKKLSSVESMNHMVTNANSRVTPETTYLNTISEDEHLVTKQEVKRQSPKLSLDLVASRRDRSYSNDFDPTLNNHQKGFVRQHSKSFSQDSINSHCSQNVIPEEKSSDFYFQKLRTLPPTEHLPTFNISLREASQNILYAFSQVHKSLRQFATFTGNERIFTTDLNKASTLIGQLSATLQRFDTYALQVAPDTDHWAKLLTVVQENISCFKSLMELLHKRLKSLTQYPDNIRFSRTLLLMLHGAVADIKFAWEHIYPLLNDYTPYTGMAAPSRARTMSRSNSNSNANGTFYSPSLPNGSSYSNGVSTPSTAGIPPFSVGSYSPYADVCFPITMFEQLLALAENSIKAVENVIKHLGEQLDSEDFYRCPSSPAKNKMKDLRVHVNGASEVTRRLKKQMLLSKSSQVQKEDLSMQHKIYKDTISFIQITVKMSTMAKELSHDWQLNSKVMTGLGHVTKCIIDLTNFLRKIEGPVGNATIPGQPPSSSDVAEQNDEYNEVDEEYVDGGYSEQGFDENDLGDSNGKSDNAEDSEEYEPVTYDEPEEYEVIGGSIQGDEMIQKGAVVLT